MPAWWRFRRRCGGLALGPRTDAGIAGALGADVRLRRRRPGPRERVGDGSSPSNSSSGYTLCMPRRVSTPAVYAMWDELGGPTGATNDLETAAITVGPSSRCGGIVRRAVVSRRRPVGQYVVVEERLRTRRNTGPATVVVTRTDRP